MTDPTLALQSVIGDKLAADPAITAHVAPSNIRAFSVRPDNMPAIVLAPAQVRILGWASGRQIVAEVRAMVHVWAVEDGSAVASTIAANVMAALMDAPKAEAFEVDEWDRPELVWMRDPDPALAYTHGAIALRAVLRWRAD